MKRTQRDERGRERGEEEEKEKEEEARARQGGHVLVTVTTRKNYDVLRGSKLEHHVFRRTGGIIRVSACDLREQVQICGTRTGSYDRD